MTDTPRTDAEERWADWNGNEFKCVHVEFARQLERELDAQRYRIIEECAMVCDQMARESLGPDYWAGSAYPAAVRALKNEAPKEAAR